MAFLALQTGIVAKVHLVFINEVLMRKDKADFEDLWTLSGLQEAVVYHKDLHFEVESRELVIFDEADEYIYEDPKAFLDFIKQHSCICLTATSGGNAAKSAERCILNHIGFKIFESALFDETEATSPLAPTWTEIELCGNEAILNHLEQ